VAFSRVITISPMDGVPTMALRVGNERGNDIIDAILRASIVRSVPTAEGVPFYRTLDLQLVRDRAPSLNRSWSVLHRIDEKSPLFGETPETLRASEAEITISLSGTDDTTLQPVHARHTYEDTSIVWGARPVDVLSETAEGDLLLDVRKFHDIEPTEATPDFPYPRVG
jgi:inward rectifier potassium channel